MTDRQHGEQPAGANQSSATTPSLEIHMESALSPREIQARVRAGESLEGVARAAGMSLEWVEPFAAPVIAEREYIAQQAQAHPVRRGGETIAHRTLAQVVLDRLSSRQVEIDSIIWDAWRIEGRRWMVRIDYDSGRSHRDARFIYDASGRFSVPDNEDARWLVGLHSASHGPQPLRRRRDEESEPTVDLNDELALVRVVQPRADESPDPENTQPLAETNGESPDADDAYAEGELAEVDGIYDIVPRSNGDLDALYEMLSSFDEDSVQIYAGLVRGQDQTGPIPVVDSRDTTAATPAGLSAPEPEGKPEPVQPDEPTPPAEPEQPALVDTDLTEPAEASPEPTEPAPTKPKTRRKRAQVPSWDEIMFGSPKKDH